MNQFVKSITEAQKTSISLDPILFITAILAALMSAILISNMYRYFYERRGTGSQANKAFPLLSISITTLFIGVQMSLPLSLGLLGALSIIRFRTPIKEPEETGFIMLVIASSITCATFQFQFLIMLMIIAWAYLWISKGTLPYFGTRQDGLMILQFKDDTQNLEAVINFVKQNTQHCQIETATHNDQGKSLHVSFTGLKQNVPAFQKAIQEIANIDHVHLFFSRPGGL